MAVSVSSRGTASEIEVEDGGGAWWSRPVGGEYDDADRDGRGRVRWVGFGRWVGGVGGASVGDGDGVGGVVGS